MFGDLMGNMKAQQEEMERSLKATKINHEFENISIELNAAKEILNIEIADEYFDADRKEELQDKLILAINDALKKAEEISAEKASSMLSTMLPGGLNGMFGQ